MTKELNAGEPVAFVQTLGNQFHEIRKTLNFERIGINDEPLYSQDYVNQLLWEISKLKAFVKPILVHGDAGIGDWDGLELQELAVKAGLLNPVTRAEPCNIGNEETQGCACREFCYGEKEWECHRIADFLLDEVKNDSE